MLTLPPVKAETEMPPSSALLRDLRLMRGATLSGTALPFSVCQ